MHHNQCINFCPEKCKLGIITIYCQKIWSEEVKCYPGSSSTRYLESWNSNFSQKLQFCSKIHFQTVTNSSLFGLKTPKRSQKRRISNIFQKAYKIPLACQIQNILAFWRKYAMALTFSWSTECQFTQKDFENLIRLSKILIWFLLLGFQKGIVSNRLNKIY